MISFSLGDSFIQEDSQALIGGIDLSQVADGKLYTYPLSNKIYWSIDTTKLKYGDVDLPMNKLGASKKYYSIIDTGTSLLSIPPYIYDNMMKAMKAQLAQQNPKVDLNCNELQDEICLADM